MQLCFPNMIKQDNVLAAVHNKTGQGMASPDPTQLTPATTSGNQEGQKNIYSEDALTLGSITILLPFLVLKFQNVGKSPFDTDFANTVAVLVSLQVYWFALLAKKKLVETLKAYAEIIYYYVHLCGWLSNVLLVVMLVPILGVIYLSMWVCCFIALTTVTYKLHVKITARQVSAAVNTKQEQNQSPDEESNVGYVNQAQNQSAG